MHRSGAMPSSYRNMVRTLTRVIVDFIASGAWAVASGESSEVRRGERFIDSLLIERRPRRMQ